LSRNCAEAGEATLEDAAHQTAGDHHVAIHQCVTDLATVAHSLNEAGASEDAQVL
jgi:hypothetical protein